MKLYIKVVLLLSAFISSIFYSTITPYIIVILFLILMHDLKQLHKYGFNGKLVGDQNKDFLTSLYSRSYFMDKINKCIKNDVKFSIFSIDLDNFKQLNDIYGHDTGDKVLVEVGKRFSNIKVQGATFARLGGDEFAILYETVHKDDIKRLVNIIKTSLEPLFVANDNEFSITASVGVARYPKDSDDAKTLLKLADIAMNYVKKTGIVDNFLISEKSIEKLDKRSKIGNILKTLDVENELFLEYQPVFDFKSGKLLGVEGLVRWKHKDMGIIGPLDFIEIAQEQDLVKNITTWVFVTGLKQIKAWNEEYNKNLIISLNVANSCIHHRMFLSSLSILLDDLKVKPKWLSIELAEECLSVLPEYMRMLLRDIDKLGVKIYLDDFGRDYASLTNLSSFSLSGVKIDTSFIESIYSDIDKKTMVKSMIDIAHNMNIKAISKGIETQIHYDILMKLGCDGYQGFYKEKPLLADTFEDKYLKNIIDLDKM